MKVSTALSLVAAPLAMAQRARDDYSAAIVDRDIETELDDRGITVVKGMRGSGININALTEVVIIWNNPGNNAATTVINKQVTVTQTVTAGVGGTVIGTSTVMEGQTATVPAKGASHTVTVGGPGGLAYQPDQLNNIPVGDTVVFEFLSQNHTVTQSPFDTPCKALQGGMDSGFQANPNNTVSPPPQVAMQVMTDKPLWFYCRQKGHCGKGMVFSINPTAAKTQAMFQAMAISQNGTGQGTPITGGNGGSASQPAAPPPQQTNTGGGGSGVTPGQGTIGADGSCSCSVSCNAGSFPAAQAQGLGAFGGMGGSLPIDMAAMG